MQRVAWQDGQPRAQWLMILLELMSPDVLAFSLGLKFEPALVGRSDFFYPKVFINAVSRCPWCFLKCSCGREEFVASREFSNYFCSSVRGNSSLQRKADLD